jgi:phospholipid transport system substrate-binding protein
MKRLLGLFVLSFGFVAASACAADVAPDVLVKDTTNEVLTLLKQDKELSTNRKKLLNLVEAKVLPHFDFARMTRIAAGRHWREATPEQQTKLINEFRSLLVNTYSGALGNYKNQVFEFLPLRAAPTDTDVTVKAKIIQPGREAIPLDTAIYKTANGWKVYDISVDGVSLLVNYRSSFAQEIQAGGIDRLIKSLTDKNAQISAGGNGKN